MGKLIYKFASRSRPDKFAACLHNITTLARHEDYEIMCTLDHDDKRLGEYLAALKAIQHLNSRVKFIVGSSTGKINAINRDLQLLTPFDILICMSDDMLFVKEGYDVQIVKDMEHHFPDTDGVLHYHDGFSSNPQTGIPLMTLSILGQKYFSRFGYIYHPSYISLWCDNEAMEVAQMIHKYKFMGKDKILFRHLHPVWTGQPYDEQYRKTESYYHLDERNYQQRKALFFDLKRK